MHAYIGRIQIINDAYTIVWLHEDTKVVDLGDLGDDGYKWEYEMAAEDIMQETGAWGYCIPDLSTLPIIYKKWDENGYSSIDQQNYNMEVRA